MLILEISDEAHEDLEQLFEIDPETAGEILSLLQELESDPDLLDYLTVIDYGKNQEAGFHVTPWWEEQKERNVWRLKIWHLENQGIQYRIFCALAGRPIKHYVLAIVDRDNIDYDDEHHPTTQRI